MKVLSLLKSLEEKKMQGEVEKQSLSVVRLLKEFMQKLIFEKCFELFS